MCEKSNTNFSHWECLNVISIKENKNSPYHKDVLDDIIIVNVSAKSKKCGNTKSYGESLFYTVSKIIRGITKLIWNFVTLIPKETSKLC